MAAMPRDVYRNFVRKLKQNIDIIIGSHITDCGCCEGFDIRDKYFIIETKALAERQ